jgi:hypothetical protein
MDGIVQKVNRIVIPKVLRPEVLDQLQYSHLREFKAKLEITLTDSKVVLSFRAH